MASSVLVGMVCVTIFVLAGICHTFWLKSPAFKSFAVPLDAGRTFLGQPIFGANKTFAGFFVMPPATSIFFGVFALFANSFQWKFLDAANWSHSITYMMMIGFLSGMAYMLGELPNSFIKRQIGIAPGANAGVIAAIFDQIDSVLAAMACLSLFLVFDATVWLTVMVLGFFAHITFNIILYKLHLKKSIL